MATEADVDASDRRAAIVALMGEWGVDKHKPYIDEGDTFLVGPRVREVALVMAEHRMRADKAGYARCVEAHHLCKHDERAPGPRIRLIGDVPAPTEACAQCGAWRITLGGTRGMWRPASKMADESIYEDPQ